MKKAIPAMAVCIFLLIGCSGSNTKDRGDITVGRNDTVVMSNLSADTCDDDASSVRTVWFLQSLHVAMDNADSTDFTESGQQ